MILLAGLILILFLIAVVGFSFALRDRKMAAVQLAELSELPPTQQDAERWISQTDSSLGRTLASRIARVDDDGRLVMTCDEDELVAALERRATSHWAYSLAPTFTGIALIMTFGIIAWTMQTSVKGAIQPAQTSLAAPSDDSRSSSAVARLRQATDLGEAVANMGSKFAISAAGVFLSIAYAAAMHDQRQRFRSAVADALMPLRARLVTLPRFQIEQAQRREDLAAARTGSVVTAVESASAAARRDVLVLQRVLSDLHRDLLAPLTSIDTSMRNMQTNIHEKFEELLARQVGERIQEMANNMAQSLLSVRDSIKNVEDAVKHQAQAPLEALVVQIRDALSGGMSSGVVDLRSSLQALERSLPSLLTNVQTVSTSLQEQMASQTSRSQENFERMTARVGDLLESVRGLTAGFPAVVARIEEAANVGASSLTGTLGQAVPQIEAMLASLVTQVARLHRDAAAQQQTVFAGLAGTQEESIARIAARLEASAAPIAAVQEQFAEHVAAANASLDQVAVRVAEQAKSLRTLNEASAVLVGRSQEQHAAAVDVMSRTRGQLEQVEGVTRGWGLAMEQQHVLVNQVSELVREVHGELESLERRGPEVATALGKALTPLADAYGAASRDIEKLLQQVNKSVIEDFGESVEQLDRTVKVLSQSLPGGGLGGGAAPAADGRPGARR